MSGYRLVVPAVGVPAMSGSHGSLGWSAATLLVGDAGVVIVDTGGPGYRPLWDAWLAHEGLARADVTRVLATHAHWDHIGCAGWFPNARIGIGAAELAWAQRVPDDPYVVPELVAAIAESSRTDRLESEDEVDGIRVVPTHGHTPGHLSYAVDTDRGPVLVVGDAVKNGGELAGGDFAITMDAAASDRARAAIRSAALDDGMSLLLGHDGLYSPQLMRVVDPEPLLTTHGELTIAGAS